MTLKKMPLLLLPLFFSYSSFAADGAKLYKDNCAMCHGDKLDGNTAIQPKPTDFHKTKFTEQQLVKVMETAMKIDGKTKLPLMAGIPNQVKTAAERKAIAEYILKETSGKKK